MNEQQPAASHSVQAAVELEHRLTEMADDIKAILVHSEHVDEHLRTQNGRLLKGEEAVARLDQAVVAHFLQAEERELYPRLEAAEKNIHALMQAHAIEEAVAGAQRKWISTAASFLDRAGTKVGPWLVAGLLALREVLK